MLRKRGGFGGWARVVARLTGRASSHTFMIREKGRLKFLYPIEEPAVIQRILTHLGLAAQPPPRAPAVRVDLLHAA